MKRVSYFQEVLEYIDSDALVSVMTTAYSDMQVGALFIVIFMLIST